MSGQNVPYQLRPNKFVERQLFLDLLDFVRVWNGPAKYVYSSMGGRFLEDFRIVNDRFAIEHMISIELDETTWKRQEFNRLGFIDCRNQSSSEFVDNFDSLNSTYNDRKFITWLDFAVANKRGEQLGEFRQLISKLSTGDVAKITVNANSQSFRRRASTLTKRDFDLYLRDSTSTTHKDFETYVRSILSMTKDDNFSDSDRLLTLSDMEYETICLGNLKEQLGDYLPAGGAEPEILQADRFATFLSNAIKTAALKGAQGASMDVIPLGIFRYRDGEHQMLTVTVLVANTELSQRVKSDKYFEEWPFRAKTWDDVIEVNVPDLSPKERHHIEGLITTDRDSSAIHSDIPFRFDKKDDASLNLLESYLKHYRRYPTFARIQ